MSNFTRESKHFKPKTQWYCLTAPGKLAGCINALACAVCYTIRKLGSFILRHSNLHFDAFVGDLVGKVIADTEEEVEMPSSRTQRRPPNLCYNRHFRRFL